MKKKKFKKMINKLKKKSERELDIEVNILSDRIKSLDTNTGVLNEKIRRMNERINHIDERTMALDNVKVQKALDKTKELDSKVKILMDRTSVHYDTYSATDTDITFENCYQIYRCMADRGATQEELNNIKNYFNKYIFRCEMFKMYKDEVPTSEEIIDGKKEI